MTELIAQTAILLFFAGMGWADLKYRIRRVEEECAKTNGRVTLLEKKIDRAA